MYPSSIFTVCTLQFVLYSSAVLQENTGKKGFFSQCVLCKVHLNNKVVCLNDKYVIWGHVCGNDEPFFIHTMEKLCMRNGIRIHYDKEFEE